ncbi:MAG TPA: hypothetical protein VGI19_16050 [Candidatus Cybelea sp.]|jgi:hypothetical protein
MVSLRSNFLRLTLAAALVASSTASAGADIPPPQHFLPSQSNPTKSERVLVISASVSTQYRPYGSVFATEGYCSVVLDVLSGTGVNATLNVMGSSDPEATTFGVGEWLPEIRPHSITNASGVTLQSKISVQVQRKVIEFFVSLPGSPGVPDMSASVGGSIRVYATAIRCPNHGTD